MEHTKVNIVSEYLQTTYHRSGFSIVDIYLIWPRFTYTCMYYGTVYLTCQSI